MVKDEPFPADLLLLATSDKGGNAKINTAPLDGETNLKTHVAEQGLMRELLGLGGADEVTPDMYEQALIRKLTDAQFSATLLFKNNNKTCC